ncbi:RING finger and WD repeat domain-containing protein 2 [Parelaphostrongylus tenuis]|uniref:RING finger and WD repeat domain-containing protein 2 n=1 Tax=Parelaphostrongylus tenuis TaxID=148309 RepID=A0AAD5MSX7_PARTN|nr:RING finger and WD repeat domain-containing protein 2 [Parelaphostrongylus tenuis]
MAENQSGPGEFRFEEAEDGASELTSSHAIHHHAFPMSIMNEHRRTLLILFFDILEERRLREIEIAKQELERCRNDRAAILAEESPARTSEESSSVAALSQLSQESWEPSAKRLCFEPSYPEVPEMDDTSSPTKGNESEDALNSSQQSYSSTSSSYVYSTVSNEALDDLRHRVARNMDILEPEYSTMRAGFGTFESGYSNHTCCFSHLTHFARVTEGITQYAQAFPVATLKYDTSCSSYHSSVSSLEFSPANTSLFSVADISRSIQVFDLKNVIEEPDDYQYPLARMECTAKISCVAWSPQTAAILVNSEYDGSVVVWDITKPRKLRKYTEHERRCCSVCFARDEDNICATGSNDCSVKIWNLNMANSAMTIRSHFIVCTVDFGFSRHEIAVGSADRSVYLYDLRQPVRPVSIFTGHRQAVSYVRYLNSYEIVSASTDNHLRLWNTVAGTCTRVLVGHRNTNNLVGLSVCGDHILTGSEDNRVYLYHKEASRPLMLYDVDTCSSFPYGTDSSFDFENESEDFVSAVAWRPDSNVILVGNSVGKVLVAELH